MLIYVLDLFDGGLKPPKLPLESATVFVKFLIFFLKNNLMGLVSDIQIYVIFLLFILVLIFLLILNYMIMFSLLVGYYAMQLVMDNKPH
jgi:hypothetical protein